MNKGEPKVLHVSFQSALISITNVLQTQRLVRKHKNYVINIPLPKKREYARKCQGLKMNGGGLDIDWCTPFCPRNQFILSPCPVPGLNEARTETGSAQRQPPRYRTQFIFPLSDCYVRGKE